MKRFLEGKDLTKYDKNLSYAELVYDLMEKSAQAYFSPPEMKGFSRTGFYQNLWVPILKKICKNSEHKTEDYGGRGSPLYIVYYKFKDGSEIEENSIRGDLYYSVRYKRKRDLKSFKSRIVNSIPYSWDKDYEYSLKRRIDERKIAPREMKWEW